MTTDRPTIIATIRDALTTLCAPGQIVELRIPKIDNKKRTDSGYFSDFGKLASAAVRYDGKASGIYFTINPVEPALLARAENRVKEWADLSTSDDYIACRRWLPIDCDPKVNGKKRPAGISSTEEEHNAAIDKAYAIADWLTSAGWPDPIIADTGNGGALLYRIELPNDKNSSALIENCLKALAARFDDSTADVDTTVFNAARIWKLYGTMAGKGDDTADRPHRRALLITVPETCQPVALVDLKALAKQVEPAASTNEHSQKSGTWSIHASDWLKKYGIGIADEKDGKDGSTIYVLDECPFNSDHAAPDACVIQHKSGALVFKCLHNGCANNDWRALRTKYEPGAYERRNGTEPAKAETKAPAAPEPTRTRPTTVKSAAIIQTLAELGYTFRLNLCSNTVEVNGTAIDDILRATMLTELRDLDFMNARAIEDAWMAEAGRNAYHPIQEYLNAQTWDGRGHIEQLAAALTCTDSPVIYSDGATVPLSTVYLWRWLIGAVAKVYEGGQNLMLVLAGPQRIGKSTLARWLCGGVPQYFIEAPITSGDKDTDIRLMDRFIWEVSELDATTRRTDVAALKAFITKQTVTVRKAYGHYDTVKPACASLLGTVNDGSGFLSDETGNRRFFVTTITSIDRAYMNLDVNQVWAQATALYRRGEPWELQPNEYESQTETNKGHEVDTPIDDWLVRYFVFTDDPNQSMSAAEIIDHLRMRYEIRLSGTNRAQAMEIASAMVKMGVKKRQRGGNSVREYVGVVPRTLG